MVSRADGQSHGQPLRNSVLRTGGHCVQGQGQDVLELLTQEQGLTWGSTEEGSWKQERLQVQISDRHPKSVGSSSPGSGHSGHSPPSPSPGLFTPHPSGVPSQPAVISAQQPGDLPTTHRGVRQPGNVSQASPTDTQCRRVLPFPVEVGHAPSPADAPGVLEVAPAQLLLSPRPLQSPGRPCSPWVSGSWWRLSELVAFSLEHLPPLSFCSLFFCPEKPDFDTKKDETTETQI